ncbi:MAG TPA: histidine phosphatase family protein [Sphingopyxis sp.]|nr:histidine phosphatase family protein [Sphingopyxis sp.]
MSGSIALHLLRHGAPETPGLLLGHQDMPASEAGAAACAAKAEPLSFDHILSSDLSRCTTSAARIAATRKMVFSTDSRWRELDFGSWDGLPPDHVAAERLHQFWADPDAHAPPQGERHADLVARIACALDDLANTTALPDASSPDRSILVITHGGAMRAALQHLLGWSYRQCWSINLPYACRLSLRLWRNDGWHGQIEALVP